MTSTASTSKEQQQPQATLPTKRLGTVWSVQGGWKAGATSLVRARNGVVSCDCPGWTATKQPCEHIRAVEAAVREARSQRGETAANPTNPAISEEQHELITKAKERLDLPLYSDWERKHLSRCIQQHDQGLPLTWEMTKLREIAQTRWELGQGFQDTLKDIRSGKRKAVRTARGNGT